ncbi:hypothetical protein, partial [Nostoc sp. FACHB-888]|uniref:hypothetical protein n=1 Tax=Nostoc sp. FACHB-888 TaxID=2692842 RepID=UPI001A7E666E
TQLTRLLPNVASLFICKMYPDYTTTERRKKFRLRLESELWSDFYVSFKLFYSLKPNQTG